MKRVAFCTLGCKTNQYDTQSMRECFLKAGYTEVPFEETADVYLINTCTVTAAGDKKSRQMISRAYRQNPKASIVLCGCYAQRKGKALKDIQGVRLVLGNGRRGDVVRLLQKAQVEDKTLVAVDSPGSFSNFEELPISSFEEKTRARLKIQDGCNQFCAYCIIPHVRGRERSRDFDEIIKEAGRLAKRGYQELMLTGIHLSAYGSDNPVHRLTDVIKALAKIDGVERIRLGSLEPLCWDESIFRELSACPKLCPHFHLSLQSGSDSVLSRMNRRYTAAQYLEIVRHIRRHFRQPAITTDVMVGFPGETPEEHAENLNFVKKVGFAKMHVFAYSKREGTAAYRMPNQVSPQDKALRMAEMLEAAKSMAESFANEFVGQTLPVLFEKETRQGAQGYIPQYVSVLAKGGKVGQIQRVRILKAQGNQLWGEVEE